MWEEVTRYGLGIVENQGGPERLSWRAGGKILTRDMTQAFPMLAGAMAKFCDVDGVGGRAVFPRAHDPFFQLAEVRKYDRLSVQARLTAMNFKPEVRDLIGAQLAALCHRDPASAGLVEQLKVWSLSDFDMSLFLDRTSRYKIEEGTTGLAHAIIADGGADVMLSTPVAKVDQGSAGVTVTTTAGAQYSAGAVVCAVPVNVLKDIQFNPGLDARKLDVSRVGATGQGTKCYIHIKQKIGKWMGAGAFPNPITMAWTEQERDDGTLLVAFGPPGLMDINDEASVQTALRTLLPGATVAATTGYQWTADPYSKGTWCYYHPGQMTQDLEALRAREQSVFFASADSALGWRGFIDGAIESGTRVAREVGVFLSKG